MEKYLSPLKKYIAPLKRYAVVIGVAVIGVAYGLLIVTAGEQANLQPSEAAVTSKFTSSARPKLDDATADKLQQLESRNITVQAIFDDARNNPFAE